MVTMLLAVAMPKLTLAILAAAGMLAVGISIAPSDAVETGLLSDVNVTFTTVETCLYDFNGKVVPAATCLGVVMEDEEGKTHTQYFSAGKQEYFVPSDDGTTFVPVIEGKESMNASTNFMALMTSLVNAGFPEDRLKDGNVKVLEGLKCHITRVAAPKRGGLVNAKGGDREQTQLIVDQILALPEEAAAATPAKKTGIGAGKPSAVASKAAPSAAKGAPTAGKSQLGTAKPGTGASVAKPAATPAAANGAGDLDDELAEMVVGVLAEQGGSVPKSKIATFIFKAEAAQGPNKQKFIARSFNDQFLESRGEWSYDGAVITLA